MKIFSMLSHSAHGSRGIIAVLSLTLSVATIIGCGGGGSSTTPSASPTPTPTPTPSVSPSPIASPAVSLTADSQDLLRGQSTRLVWNSQNTSAVAESNFDATTLAGEKIVTPLATTTYSLTVRNEGGQTVVGSVEVRVATVAITALSSSPTVDVSSSLTFGAQVTGAVDAGVTWSVQELGGGVITESGSYTAPATAGTYHVQATSNADPSKVAVVEVRVRAASGSVTVN